jgi:regulator of PEP synthase PpsR (kinase-PPPase family)
MTLSEPQVMPMNTTVDALHPGQPPPVYVVSGGIGASGERLVQTVLVQFPGSKVPVIVTPHLRRAEQIEDIVEQAAKTQGTIVHTLVDARLRRLLVEQAQAQGVVTIDLMGGLLTRLTEVLGQEPVVRPGLYRQLNEAYFRRIQAMEFAITHDDGHRAHDWPLAEMVLTGVSRVGKTPLSMYLSVQGWKVANLPLVLGQSPPPELFELEPGRVIGLHLEPGQLLFHRQQRQRRLGAPGPSVYTDPAQIYEEVEAARQIFRRGRFPVIDVTDKPIETSAEEVIELISRRFRTEGHLVNDN